MLFHDSLDASQATASAHMYAPGNAMPPESLTKPLQSEEAQLLHVILIAV